MTGVATGFSDLDHLTAGWQAGDMIIVAARPAMGKTTWALGAAQHAALREHLPVAVFSLETSSEQLVARMLCAEAGVENTKLRTGFLGDEDWRKLARAMGALSEAPIYIDDSPTLSAMEIRAKARKVKAEHGLGLVVVDYIQMIQARSRSENRTHELSEIARALKSLAKETGGPLIAISQLSRVAEGLGARRAMLSHLRESGGAGSRGGRGAVVVPGGLLRPRESAAGGEGERVRGDRGEAPEQAGGDDRALLRQGDVAVQQPGGPSVSAIES